jgi:hypothetical protein
MAPHPVAVGHVGIRVPYAYYAKLKPRQKAIYRRSDRVTEIELPHATALQPLVEALEQALAAQSRTAVERAVQGLSNSLLLSVGIPPLRTKVLATRPSRSWGELHGQYEPRDGRTPPLVTVWMRTAHHKRVVAFRTFLRTVLHELCHHLDYELLGLEDSFHTEGFFKRESSLFNQLVP